MNTKKYIAIFAIVTLTFLASCGTSVNTNTSETENSTEITKSVSEEIVESTSENTETTDTSSTEEETTKVTLSETLNITEAGIYELSGTITDGQIFVDAGEDAEVILKLDGVNVTNSNGPALYAQSGKVTLDTKSDTNNTFTDGKTYENEELNAAIYAVEDLKIKGKGTIEVIGNFADGIKTKDDLKLKGGTIIVQAADDGVIGNDSIEIDDDVTLSITAQQDGLKSNNDTEGSILIEGGNITINAGDDGIKAYSTLTIENGNIDIQQSYEGLEAEIIAINDGTVQITSSDDGVNATSSDENANERGAQTGVFFYINGGDITVNAAGDGLDSNGNIEMKGGKVTVYGPIENKNGALDYNGSFTVTAGDLIAFGSSGMAQNISEASTQASVKITFSGNQAAGTSFELLDSNGNTVASGTSKKVFASVVVSNDSIVDGETYTYKLNGTETGTQIAQQNDSEGGMMGGRGMRGR